MSHLDFKKSPCHCVEFKKQLCRPVGFRGLDPSRWEATMERRYVVGDIGPRAFSMLNQRGSLIDPFWSTDSDCNRLSGPWQLWSTRPVVLADWTHRCATSSRRLGESPPNFTTINRLRFKLMLFSLWFKLYHMTELERLIVSPLIFEIW